MVGELSRSSLAAFAAASYVRETNTDQWGIIDRVTYDDHVLKVSGRMLDGILMA